MAHLVNAANHIPALPGVLLTGEDGPLYMTQGQVRHELLKAWDRGNSGRWTYLRRCQRVINEVDEILDRLTAGRD